MANNGTKKNDLTFHLLTKLYFHAVRKILLFPCLLITLSALCQTEPRLKHDRKTSESNKLKIVLPQLVPPKETPKNKVKTAKKSEKKLTVSKPTDHLFDLVNEPE